MSPDQDALVLAVSAELRALARDVASPEAALERMRAVAERHGGRVELVFEPDPHGQTHHVDAIVDEPAGALTLRFCPDRGLPFLLRGAERLRDRDLVRVDGQVLQVQSAIALLDVVWNQQPLMKRLIDVCIMEAELAHDPVEVSDDQVQEALDRIRASHGLYSAAATHRWMAERGMTHEMLERYAGEQAAILALQRRVAAGAVGAHFEAHRRDYDAATAAILTIPDDAPGRAFVEGVVADRVGVATAFAAWVGRDAGASRAAPRFANVVRRDLSGPLRTAVFDSDVGHLQIVRDPNADGGAAFHLVQVFAIRPAALDAATRDRISDELFEAWLAARRAAAVIEWNWGRADRTRLG